MILHNKKYFRFYEGDKYAAFIQLFQLKDIVVVDNYCYLPHEFFYFRNKTDYINELIRYMNEKK